MFTEPEARKEPKEGSTGKATAGEGQASQGAEGKAQGR